MARKIRNTAKSLLIFFLNGMLFVSLGFVAATFYMLARHAGHEQEWIRLTTEAQVASQQLAKSASEAAGGNLNAFAELKETSVRMATDMQELQEGSTAKRLPPVPEPARDTLNSLSATWERVSTNAASITALEQLVHALADASGGFSAVIPGIQKHADGAATALMQSGAPTAQVLAASRLMLLADRMQRRSGEILQGGANAVSAADKLKSDITLFDQVLAALFKGSDSLGIRPVINQQALAELGQLRGQFNAARPHLQAVLDSSTDLFSVRGAADEILLDSRDMFTEAARLSEAISGLPSNRLWPSLATGVIGLAVTIGLVLILGFSTIASERRRASSATSSTRKQQQAIMKLLDELSSLANGDLTVKASVNDEVTGAIADAVNYAVEQLRELVRGINDTANAVAESAQVTRTSSAELAEVANAQAEQVGDATHNVLQMAEALGSMAQRAHTSSDLAHQSVDIAHRGAVKVRETIRGMDTIRDQIQETSKRIKRLGESSQEIGDIVRLIKGIAEQTNVLALNAAIQAASAGGAGKGFAVVADEVQQLAESATQATRRIELLVQTIQADTSEAVDSMESTTAEVVNGAQMAEDAGRALEKIEKSSTDLSALIEEISREAQAQSEATTDISALMREVQDVSVKTSETSQQTVGRVENLAELVIRLSESVADFKLPKSR